MGRGSSVQFFFWFLIKFLQKCSLSLFQTHLFLLGHPRFSSHHRLGSLFLFMGILCRSNGHRIAQAQCLTPTVWLSHYLLWVALRGRRVQTDPYPLSEPYGHHPFERDPSIFTICVWAVCKQTMLVYIIYLHTIGFERGNVRPTTKGSSQ